MPVRPENRKHYSRKAGWHLVVARILLRAGETCECRGECGSVHRNGRCSVPHRKSIVRSRADPQTWELHVGGMDLGDGYVVVAEVGVAHLDHNPENNDDTNLRGLCQRCHLLYDGRQHRQSQIRAAFERQRQRGQQDLVLDLLGRRASQVGGEDPASS